MDPICNQSIPILTIGTQTAVHNIWILMRHIHWRWILLLESTMVEFGHQERINTMILSMTNVQLSPNLGDQDVDTSPIRKRRSLLLPPEQESQNVPPPAPDANWNQNKNKNESQKYPKPMFQARNANQPRKAPRTTKMMMMVGFRA